jgi:hypothetical protein
VGGPALATTVRVVERDDREALLDEGDSRRQAVGSGIFFVVISDAVIFKVIVKII